MTPYNGAVKVDNRYPLLPSSWLFHVDIITAWLLVHHPHGNDPRGKNTCPWATSWRHPDSHQQTSVHLLMHAPRYSVKGGNIPPERRYSLVDQASMAASPVFGEAPPRLAEKRKKLKLSCCIGFNNVPVLRPFAQNLYIYIWELCRTGGFVSVECRVGHIFSL